MDKLKQLGNHLGHTKDQNEYTTRTYAKNLFIVEKSADRVGTLYTFRMDFYTYTDSPLVTIDLTFYPRYRGITWIGAGVGG